MSIRFSRVIFTAWILLYTGCSSNAREEPISTPRSLAITSTLSVSQSPLPLETGIPPSAQPTAPAIAPVEGITATQINVRAEPSTSSSILGIIPADTKVEITGRDPAGNWWQINYPQGVDGKGWVTAQYVTTSSTPQVPSVGAGETGSNTGNVATVQQQINVRSGPGTDFNSLGTLNPQEVVGLTGKDANGVWLQIDFAAGPEGKGWISAAFVQAQGVENLPIITETGRVVGTGTPTSIPFTPSPTLVPAWDDNDSPDHPIASVLFELTGTDTLIYNGELSSPEGDSADWIAFQPYTSFVFASLACTGSHLLKTEITENNVPVSLDLACGDQMKQMPVNAGASYLIHLQALPSTENLQYTHYILTIKTRPE